MIVGKTGSGKSEAWKCLQRTLGKLKAAHPGVESLQAVHVYTINPLALSNDELYGSFEEVCRTHTHTNTHMAVVVCLVVCSACPVQGVREEGGLESLRSVLVARHPARGSDGEYVPPGTCVRLPSISDIVFACLQATHEWQDGVLARIMRGACKDESPDQVNNCCQSSIIIIIIRKGPLSPHNAIGFLPLAPSSMRGSISNV
jgi:hypothetical protein